VFATDVIQGILRTEVFIVSEPGIQGGDSVVRRLAVGLHEGEGGVLVRREKERDGTSVVDAIEELASKRDFTHQDGDRVVGL
jgi:hypothetical protein